MAPNLRHNNDPAPRPLYVAAGRPETSQNDRARIPARHRAHRRVLQSESDLRECDVSLSECAVYSNVKGILPLSLDYFSYALGLKC